MNEIQKLTVLKIALEDAMDNGDLIYDIEGVSEDEAYSFLKEEVNEIEIKIKKLEKEETCQ